MRTCRPWRALRVACLVGLQCVEMHTGTALPYVAVSRVLATLPGRTKSCTARCAVVRDTDVAKPSILYFVIVSYP